jgi:hypothetical protein
VLRKIMAGVVLCSVPVLSFGVAEVATTGTAFAGPTTLCTGTGSGQVVTFTAPGISNQGIAQASAKSTTKTGAGTLSCKSGSKVKSGSVSPSTIKSKSTETCAGDTNPNGPPAACAGNPTWFVIDDVSGFAAAAGDLKKDLKSVSFKVGTTSYVADTTGSSAATACGTMGGSEPVCTNPPTPGYCPDTEVGFFITGHLSTSTTKSTEITACLNTDTNTGGSAPPGNFLQDLTAIAGGNLSITVQTATEDPATSTIEFG